MTLAHTTGPAQSLITGTARPLVLKLPVGPNAMTEWRASVASRWRPLRPSVSRPGTVRSTRSGLSSDGRAQPAPRGAPLTVSRNRIRSSRLFGERSTSRGRDITNTVRTATSAVGRSSAPAASAKDTDISPAARRATTFWASHVDRSTQPMEARKAPRDVGLSQRRESHR